MLSAGAAALAGMIATVYSYNLGKFQFDANQAQNSAHQSQNMRVALWSLFREDVRDLFGITASNMTTYMVVGTLIVSCAMNFIWNGYKDYPTDPPWLLVIWNNSVFVCITFGLLSVWLAMHGAISSNSACAKILTQAVRTPIPNLSEVAQVRAAQDEYERAGAWAFLQVPILHTYIKRVGQSIRRRIREGAQRRVGRQRQPSSILRRTHTVSVCPQVQEVLHDGDGGPGSSAVNSSHFWLLRQVQRSYACYDAYARISLSVSASQLLLVDAYYALGHFMSKSQGWPSPVQNTAAAWLAVGTAVFATVLLFRLDLFIVSKEMRRVQAVMVAGPLVACVATHLACIRTNFGRGGFKPSEQVVPGLLPWALALVSCILHAYWILVIREVSEPAGGKEGLPLNFRSAHYLNVFGWHFSHMLGSGTASVSGTGLFTLSDGSGEDGDLSTNPMAFTRSVTPDNNSAAEPFEVMPERPDMPKESRAVPWKYFSITCYAVTGLWSVALVVIALDPSYRESVMAPRDMYSRTVWTRRNVSFPHPFFRPFALGCSTVSRTMAIGDIFAVYMNDLPVDVASLRHIGAETRFSVSDFQNSWKGLGVVDARASLLNGSSVASTGAAEPVGAPRRGLRGHVSYARYGSGRGTNNVSSRAISSSSSSSSSSGSSSQALQTDNPPQALLILQDKGEVVEEHYLGAPNSTGRLVRMWQISEALVSAVEAIEAVQGHLAEPCRRHYPPPRDVSWGGIFAATDHGQVVLLCPRERTLEPLYVVASLRRRQSVPWVVSETANKAERQKLLGVHVDSSRELVWLLAARSDGVAEVRAWGLKTGDLFGQWDLPTGRRWAAGICGLGGSNGLLLAASAEFTPAAHPEVWHLKF